MKSKVLKITNIILICCILIQTTSIIFINNKVYAESAENVINTVLGDIKVEVEGSGLKDGRVITITVSTTAENITSLGFYLEYDQSVFEKLDVKSDVELDYITEEWKDRFAKPPESVENLIKLIRTQAGSFRVENSVELDGIDVAKNILNPLDVLDLPKIYVNGEDLERIKNGNQNSKMNFRKTIENGL